MALVLTRKEGESLQIGENVTVTVYRCRSGETRLRIDAPKEVRILRAEVKPADPSEGESEATE
jgi:carbon storage regulator